MTALKKKKPGSVFYLSILIVAVIVAWGVFATDNFNSVTSAGLQWVTTNLGWFYVMTTAVFVVFSIYLAFGRNQDVKLGSDDSEPNYSFLSWIGMLFAAGMGVGLVFWGTAEPILHYIEPPPGVEGRTVEAARASLVYSIFHWGIQPWAIYAVVGIAIAYFKFRKNKPSLISETLRPVLGNKVDGPLGKTVNIIATVATTVGIATTFGFSAMQMSGGISEVFGTPNSVMVQLIITGVVGVVFIGVVFAGIDKGMRRLSNANLALAALLLLAVFLFGPTVRLIGDFFVSLGTYIRDYAYLSLELHPNRDTNWQAEWTFFYWGWLIAWAPFVGMFIARVSRGRTIREFVLGALLVPALLGAFWFVVFGGTAIYLERSGAADIAAKAQNTPEIALFLLLDELPFGFALSILALVLIIIFFVTSAVSATYVLGVLSSAGTLKPSKKIQAAWGAGIIGIAATLLLSGGLEALQAASVIVALPFAFILLVVCLSMGLALKRERQEAGEGGKQEARES
ncbi:BCCT family transporter [Planococcus lenghuensis]|uniref:Glycine/betaine ABC transporter permease n=1 Tax=Planococcus lenghuensis TaxID=2213202 RepID=A0A1Q2L274_9BACL|nr:BCCT family transporter [Planococcus lenghuensis]AQQ54539.1 glycine/betaine ABC transporter permease [Planococcus lenghuensis]